MVNFKERVVTAAAFLVTLIIIFSSNNNLNRARISLALPIYRPLTGTIDRIARQNGVLPRFWSTAGATSLSHQDAEDVSANVPKIMGLVFFGRRDTVSIIDCYLKVSSPCRSTPYFHL